MSDSTNPANPTNHGDSHQDEHDQQHDQQHDQNDQQHDQNDQNDSREQSLEQGQDPPAPTTASRETTAEAAGGDTEAKRVEQSSSQAETSEQATSDQDQQEPPAGTTTPSTLFGSDELEGMKSEEQKKKDAEEAEKKKRQEAAKHTGGEKIFPSGTEFRYSGHTKVLEEDMTETKIFEWVADDFPEIEKGRHTLRYDKDKGRLVPIPQAQKKGTDGTATKEDRRPVEVMQVKTMPPTGKAPPVYRLLCEDGVYEVRTNLTGTYVVRLDSEATLAEGYYPAVPKAPATLLAEIVRIFKDRPETEALIDLVYNRREGTFCLVWNQKSANAGSVDYQPLPDDDTFVLYAEIHSHHKMSAYWSSTDDESERGTGVYGVVGRITGELPEARFRYSCGGHFRELLAEDLFDDPSTVASTIKRPAGLV